MTTAIFPTSTGPSPGSATSTACTASWRRTTPRWEQNGQGLCLEIGEYYDEMLRLMGQLVKAGLSIQVDVWQFVYDHPRTKRYYFHPVVAECGRYRDSIPLCKGARGTIAVALTKDMLHYDPSKCLFFKGGYMKKIDDVFAAADPEYRCGNDTGELDRAGDPKGLTR